MSELKPARMPRAIPPARRAAAELTLRGRNEGPGVEVVDLPAFAGPVVARVQAWATGYGDPDYAGCSAVLVLRVDDKVVANTHEADFTLYQLVIVKAIEIPARTPRKISINFDNHLATEAGDPAHGLLVTVTQAR